MAYFINRLIQQEEIRADNPGHNPQPVAGKAIWPVEVLDAPGVFGPDLARYVVAVQKGVQVTGLKVGADGTVLTRDQVARSFPWSFSLGADNYTFLLRAETDGFVQEALREFAVRTVSTQEPIYVTGRRPFRTSSKGWGTARETLSDLRIKVRPDIRPPRVENNVIGDEIYSANLPTFVDLKPFVPADVPDIAYEPNDIRYLATAADRTFGYTYRRGRETTDNPWQASDSFIYQVGAPPRQIYYRNVVYSRLGITNEGGFDIYGVLLVYNDSATDSRGRTTTIRRVVSVHNLGDLERVWLQLFEEGGRDPTRVDEYQLAAYRAVQYRGRQYGRDVFGDFVQFREGLQANQDGLSVTLKQYDRRDNLLSQSTRTIPPRNGTDPQTGVVLFNVHRPEPVTKLEVESPTPTLITGVTFGASRTFNSDSIQFYELTGRPAAQLWLQGVGPEIRVPSNATAGADLSLTFSGAWDGATFRMARTNDPVWWLLEVLTNERWKVSMPLGRIDLASFYQASVFNNGARKWCFDGPLVGTTNEVVTDLLASMNAVLSQASDGRFVVGQERPGTAKWMIDQTLCASRLVYREASVKPAIVSDFVSNESGNRITLPVLDTVTKRHTYPGQNRECAVRWANWRSFVQANLLDTVEFTVPVRAESCSDCYRMQLYDILEVHDNLQSGVQTSGRITEVAEDGSWVQLDHLPRELLPVSGLRVSYEDDTNGWIHAGFRSALRIQRVQGGIISWLVGGARWDPCEPSRNRFYFRAPRRDLVAGQMWALVNAQVSPRLYRIVTISEQEDGLLQRVMARPYFQNMHQFVDTGGPLPVQPNHIYKPRCGTGMNTFRGPVNQLSQNYQVTRTRDLNNSCAAVL